MWKTATAVQGGLIQTKESNDFQSLNQLSNFEQKIKVTIVWLQLLKWDFFLSLSLSLTVNRISLGCGQNMTFEDIILGSGKHSLTFLTILLTKQLIN